MKKLLPDLIAILAFVLLSFAYFFPADIENRILFQHDTAAGAGAGQEVKEYYEQTGERSRWTNSLFGGMPMYQIAPSYDSTKSLQWVQKAYQLFLPDYVCLTFMLMLGFYILLRVFGIPVWLAGLGGIMWAFSSYFFILISAGHIWKFITLAYVPPTIAGIVLAYRGKLLWGGILTALFVALQITSNHVQMSYYFFFVILFFVGAYFEKAWRTKTLPQFFKASAVLIVAALVGIAANVSNLYHTYAYSKETMRGKSELVQTGDAAKQTSSGLDRDYITQWSYGIDETWTLLIPNVKGGASVPLAANETAMEKANPEFYPIYQQIGQYWGEQPGTSGPVYVGAFVLMLFVLGLFIVKGPMKWALLAATVLSVLLSWGRNFMPFTDFFLDYVPLYAKFRTVASILVIAEFTIPLLAMMALRRIVEDPQVLTRNMRWVYVSFGLTAGVALLFALMPGFFFNDFISSSERVALGQVPDEYRHALMANLTEMRQAVMTADCWRSFWIVTVGVVMLLLYRINKLKAAYMIAGVGVLCLVDMWQVNKRYLNDGMFVEKSVREAPQPMSHTDQLILKDKGLDYRVLNLATNTFNENETSYYHKSIGGYHAAKLRRYQEMIEAYINPQMSRIMKAVADSDGDMTRVNGDSLFPVLNMLNTKYIIVPLQGGQTVPLLNPYAYGNAWFVDRLTFADNANQEIERIGQIDLRHEAVADKRFADVLGEAVAQDKNSVAKLLAYEPNQLTYEVSSDKGGVLVFSEVYYPGWTATIDGQPAELGRVNYILRALRVPAGKHQVKLAFFPKSVDTTETIAYVAYVVLLLIIVGGLYDTWRRKKNNQTTH